jgi:hypothetical protein
MKTIARIPVTVEHVDVMPELNDMQEHIIYYMESRSTAIHFCLCGCKETACTPINEDFWQIIETPKGATFTPSILNTNCPNRYHYVITDGVANVLER